MYTFIRQWTMSHGNSQKKVFSTNKNTKKFSFDFIELIIKFFKR